MTYSKSITWWILHNVVVLIRGDQHHCFDQGWQTSLSSLRLTNNIVLIRSDQLHCFDQGWLKLGVTNIIVLIRIAQHHSLDRVAQHHCLDQGYPTSMYSSGVPNIIVLISGIYPDQDSLNLLTFFYQKLT